MKTNRQYIMDEFDGAIEALYKLVSDKDAADKHVQTLNYCKVILADAFNSVRDIEAKVYHANRNIDLYATQLKERA